MDVPYWKYLVKYFLCNENAVVCHYLKTLRYCEYHLNNRGLHHKILYCFHKIRLNRLALKYGINVPINRTGYGLRLMHISGGVVLNIERCGIYCGFNYGVLLGNKGSNIARPLIGDYTSFGPGAKAFGKITIGNNVFVAPNAVVTKDVPDRCVVGGVPAKVIKTL